MVKLYLQTVLLFHHHLRKKESIRVGHSNVYVMFASLWEHQVRSRQADFFLHSILSGKVVKVQHLVGKRIGCLLKTTPLLLSNHQITLG